MNLTADRLNWEREIQRQLAEDRERHEANRVRALQQFEDDLRAWKEMHSQLNFTHSIEFKYFKMKWHQKMT